MYLLQVQGISSCFTTRSGAQPDKRGRLRRRRACRDRRLLRLLDLAEARQIGALDGPWALPKNSLNNLAELYRALGNYADAEPLYRRSVAIWEMALGPEHPHVAQGLDNYAALLRETGRADEAAEMEARARAIRAKYE